MKASDLLVKCLENEGIEYIFGVPGEENADFMISLEASGKIKFILTRHEQGAAFMAEIYGRLTGNPAGALGTLGPGATNLLTGLWDANVDRAPALALTGQVDTQVLGPGAFQLFLYMSGALQRGLLGLPDFLQVRELTLKLTNGFLKVGQALFGCLVLFFFQCLAFDFQLHDLAVYLVQGLGLGVDLGAQTGRGLINQVNSLIWKKPIGYIPTR